MSRRSLWLMPAVAAAVSIAMTGSARAASWQEQFLDPAVRSWMAVLTLVAEDGERATQAQEGDARSERARRRGSERGRPGPEARPAAGPPPGGPRMDALGKLDEVLSRLGRIETMLAGRPWPPRGPAPGPHGHGPNAGRAGRQLHRPYGGMPSMTREHWGQMSAEERADMRRKMAARMEGGGGPRAEGSRGRAGTEAMQAAVLERFAEARKRFAAMEERIKSLEAQVERLARELKRKGED
jgi:hypothetical protein